MIQDSHFSRENDASAAYKGSLDKKIGSKGDDWSQFLQFDMANLKVMVLRLRRWSLEEVLIPWVQLVVRNKEGWNS